MTPAALGGALDGHAVAAVVAALVGAAVLAWPGRPRPAPLRRDRAPGDGAGPRPPEVDPALLCDLVAAVVSAGAAPAAAVAAVAAVVREAGSPAAEALERVAARGGAPPSAGAPRPGGLAAPGRTTPAPDFAEALTALQRALWIAEQTGAPVAALLVSAAGELRRRRRRAAALAAARLGVRAVAPLGLCTLPAFALLAVAPVLLSLGRGLLG